MPIKKSYTINGCIFLDRIYGRKEGIQLSQSFGTDDYISAAIEKHADMIDSYDTTDAAFC